jgi:cytochrome P450
MAHSPRQGSEDARTLTLVTAAPLPPGPRLAPLNMLGWVTRPIPFMERCRARYGDRFTVDMGPPEGKWIFLTQPDEIREMFTAPADVLHPGEGAQVLEPVVGSRSVLLLDGREHLSQRKLMLPAFHGERMRALVGVMEEVAEGEVAAWRPHERFGLHERTQALTLEIILRAVFGLAAGPQLDELRVTLKQLLDLGASPLTLLPPFRRRLGPLTTWSRFVDVRAHADKLILALVDERRRAGEETDDVLSMLLAARDEDGQPMTDRELRDELVTLLVAGHETTASALSWGFEQLLRAPDVLERVTRAAVDDDSAYLEATVKEILRRRPVLPIAQPRRIKQPVEIGGREYPAGPAFTACIYLVQHDERIYPEPYAFRPERFLDGSPGTYSWIPFGGGVRRCLGASFAQLELRIALRAILSALEVTRRCQGARAPAAARSRSAPAAARRSRCARACPRHTSPSAFDPLRARARIPSHAQVFSQCGVRTC